MTVIELNTDTLLSAVEEVVAERGRDYVYDKTRPGWSFDAGYYTPTCVYQTPEGEPACIYGAALAKIDPSLVPEHHVADGIRHVLSELANRPDVNVILTRMDEDYFAGAQIDQDGGQDYGTVLDNLRGGLGR
jgi:hypothetical protein